MSGNGEYPMKPDVVKQFRHEFYSAEEHSANILTNALAQTYEDVTGRRASERLWDKLHDAVRFER
jgi:hypothetical protein